MMPDSRTFRVLFVGTLITIMLAVSSIFSLMLFLPWLRDQQEMRSLFDELKHADKTDNKRFSWLVIHNGRFVLSQSKDNELIAIVERVVSRSERAVPWLIDALTDEDDKMRLCAVYALGEIGPKADSAVSPLLELMKDEDNVLRVVAVDALKKIAPREKRSVPVMISLLDDESPSVRWAALSYFEGVGPEARPAIPTLIKIFQTDPEAGSRISIARALGKIGPDAKAAVPILLKAQRDQMHVAEETAKTIAKIGSSAVPALLDSLQCSNELTRVYAANLLGRIGPKAQEAVPVLINALRDESADVRYAVTRALGQIGPGAKQAVDALANSLNDENVLVRRGAEYSLQQIDPEAWASHQ